MKSRIQALLKSLNQGVYEKETEIGLSLLAAVSGQSILLLGPPGVAKSMIGRCLKQAFTHARSFEYLMSRFSTPDELFGPVSISKLKTSDVYERCVDGYLPTADVVFLDEIWKAGPAIQNTLLTVINEKTYLNGQTRLRLPLKLLIGASNELPTEGEGLEAMWDRFIIRVVCQPIGKEDNFYRMLDAQPVEAGLQEQDLPDAFSAEEYTRIQQEIDEIRLPDEVLQAVSAIRRALKDVKIEGQDVHRTLYVSDRRWNRIARLMRASALMHDRKEVNLSDLQVAGHCLWNEPDEFPAVCSIVADAIFGSYRQRLDRMNQAVGYAMKRRLVRESADLAHSRGDHRDDDLLIYDGLYYGIDEHTFIYVTDFRSMPTHSANEPAIRGVMYQDPRQPKRRIIRAYTNPDNIGVYETELTRVNLYRDSRSLYINGVRYALHRGLPGQKLEVESGLEPLVAMPEGGLEAYETQVDSLFVEASTLHNSLKGHLFATDAVTNMLSAYMDTFRKQVALLRADVRKLLYDE